MLTKFDELTDILTDAGKDDFFQATYSDDQIPTSSELAEGLSTNVPASSRIPTVIWKIRIPNVHYKSVNELHYVPSNEGKIRRDGYLLSYFWRGAIWWIYISVFTSNFFTDDGCEHAKMKQFTLAPSNYTPSVFVRNLSDRLFSAKYIMFLPMKER